MGREREGLIESSETETGEREKGDYWKCSSNNPLFFPLKSKSQPTNQPNIY
jgi:hypothetical protein